MDKQPPWSLLPDKILHLLESHKERGLLHSEARKRLVEFGPNQIKSQRQISRYKLLLRQFQNPMVYTLGVAALIAIYLNEYLDAGAILTILLINSLIAYFQESKSHDAIAALKKLSSPRVRVLREWKIKTIPSEQIVPGDIIQIEAGDYVSADARIIEAYQLTANESSLTGESLPVEKSVEIIDSSSELGDRKNMLHSGTAVNSGSGLAIVTRTGMGTEIGKIAGMLSKQEFLKTPLQEKLEGVTRKLIYLGLIVIVLVIIIHIKKGDPWFLIFMSAISLAVAAIPEGLPTVVTLALTLAVRRMTKRNALVRDLASVEALGSIDYICTDKTGTLTKGIMSAREHFILSPELQTYFFNGLILCNNSTLDDGGTGDTTEIALLNYCAQMDVPITEVKSQFIREHEWSFDSHRKRMSVRVTENSSSRSFIYVKGAPESVIPVCDLTDESRNEIENQMTSLASRGLRVLAVAFKNGDSSSKVEEAEKNLAFCGLIALSDPPREESKAAIKECQNAGIRVVMITGDHAATAKAIADELGILIPHHDKVITGKELDQLSEDDLTKRVEEIAVYARVSPFHKLKIIKALQKNDHIVSMTGDGVNDAPALKTAQIGVAMGKGGTEVARQASNIILTDDNFATIVSAIEEGRAIYANIRQTIQYLLSTNLAEILIVLGSAVFGLDTPFNPMGLLWINIVTDGLPSLALAAEPLDKNILSNSSRPSPRTFFESRFILEMVLVGLLITVIGLGTYIYMLQEGNVRLARSWAFTLLVFLGLSRSFSCRSEKLTFFQLGTNVYFLLAVVITFILHSFFQRTVLFQEIFEVDALTLSELSFLFIISLIPSTLVELYKLYAQRLKKNNRF